MSINDTIDTNTSLVREDLTEISSIDLGNKDERNFDEMITFTHHFYNNKKFEGLTTIVDEFPYLLNQEFLLANTNIDEKFFNSMNNKEILQLVKSRAQTYLNEGDINFKTLVLENLVNYASEIGFENTVDILLPIVLKIPQEKDSVKIKFLQVCKKFTAYLYSNGEEGYKLLRDQIIQVLNQIFQDRKNVRVIELCSEALVDITSYVKDDEKGYHILTVVIFMANDDTDEESRVLAAKLFNQLAPLIGRELCELYIVPHIASFADDPQSKVRKAVACNFLNMCTSVSEVLFKTKLLPVYQKLSKDSLWIVRKAAAENLPKITALCDSETISTTLLEVFKNFTSDNQKYVRIAAVEVLGQFVALLKKEDLTKSILEFYINIIDEYYNNSNTNEADIIYHCAYNFPAVLYSFGQDTWDDLKRVYFKMTGDKDSRVKRSLASSLAEIANILGPEITEKELIPILDKFYNMEGEIQNTILKILPEFLKKIPQSLRRNYLDKLKRLLNPREKWRSRMEYSKIIGKYCNVFDDDVTYKQIFPIALNFCLDDVAQVRFKAAKNISGIILQLLKAENLRDKTMKIIETFAYSVNYNYRQLFALMCTEIFSDEQVTEFILGKFLVPLARDRVVNVRVTVGKVISKLFKHKKFSWAIENESVNKMAWNLKNDVNKNVSFNFEGLESIKHYDDVDLTFTDSSLFDNKMEILKEEFGLVRNLPPVNAKILIRNTHAKEEEPDTTKPVESEEDLTGTDSK